MAVRELHAVSAGALRLVVERLDDGYITFRAFTPGPRDSEPILSGVVHDPDSDYRLGARRVLTALGGHVPLRDALGLVTQ